MIVSQGVVLVQQVLGQMYYLYRYLRRMVTDVSSRNVSGPPAGFTFFYVIHITFGPLRRHISRLKREKQMRYLADNTGQTIRRAAIELFIGLLFLGAVAFWVHSNRNGSAAPMADRKTLVAQLRQDMDRAIANARLTGEQRAKLTEARATLREIEAARKKGIQVDQTRSRAAAETLRQLLATDAFRPEDRRAIERSLESLGDLRRVEHARRRQLRRDSLVQHLGFPLGLLADYAAESL